MKKAQEVGNMWFFWGGLIPQNKMKENT
jgi:hypothetical protein